MSATSLPNANVVPCAEDYGSPFNTAVSRGRTLERFEGIKVENTFITDGLVRSPSLEPFLKERRANSCPPTPQVSCFKSPSCCDDGCASLSDVATTLQDADSNQSTADTEDYFDGGVVEADSFEYQRTDQVLSSWPPYDASFCSVLNVDSWVRNRIISWPTATICEDGSATLVLQGRQESENDPILATLLSGIPPALPVLRLEKALDFAPPVLRLEGALEPRGCRGLTIASRVHESGQCKPCAFFHTAAGCGNGANCCFCHLCGPDEKKNKKKEKQAARRAMKEVRSLVASTRLR